MAGFDSIPSTLRYITSTEKPTSWLTGLRPFSIRIEASLSKALVMALERVP